MTFIKSQKKNQSFYNYDIVLFYPEIFKLYPHINMWLKTLPSGVYA
jgi:hypothetical protein